MFEQLPGMWKREAATEHEIAFSRKLLFIALSIGVVGMLSRVVESLLRHSG